MNNSKRNKIQAKLDCPATPEPEREVCRNILGDNPMRPFSCSPPSDGSVFEFMGFKIHVDLPDQPDIHAFHVNSCEQCGNQFYVVTEKDLYCPICLAAKRREAEK